MSERSDWAHEQVALLEEGWERLLEIVERLGPEGLERSIRGGWTVKEMLAHLAFWEETSWPVTEWMHRGGSEPPVARWYGGTDLEIASGEPWPDADTHNEREARWARAHTNAEVLDRCLQAHRRLVEIVATVTSDEAEGAIGEHLSGIRRHTQQHVDELETLVSD